MFRACRRSRSDLRTYPTYDRAGDNQVLPNIAEMSCSGHESVSKQLRYFFRGSGLGIHASTFHAVLGPFWASALNVAIDMRCSAHIAGASRLCLFVSSPDLRPEI